MENYSIGKPGQDDNRKWADVKHLFTPEQVALIEAQQQAAQGK